MAWLMPLVVPVGQVDGGLVRQRERDAFRGNHLADGADAVGGRAKALAHAGVQQAQRAARSQAAHAEAARGSCLQDAIERVGSLLVAVAVVGTRGREVAAKLGQPLVAQGRALQHEANGVRGSDGRGSCGPRP